MPSPGPAPTTTSVFAIENPPRIGEPDEERQLERDGLLTRTVYASVPPRVEYTLTELGLTLLDAATALGDWAATHRKEVGDNRLRYDDTHPLQKRP
ncbi:winged helix-turn-helix transcriptional regulator [Streptomyces sp. NBRC 110611]|uniref:winged helix-turn-helix transcriptional regulator n=1 Tax=Streptomyces sp. NBRC 110611 TaxID=1621259 RepID=UPI00099FBC21|nr:winged helix-turn-helix transcriptional regulator [Streptomyces sp. NBRC 110611]